MALWKSDGTAAGTTVVKDTPASDLTAVGGTLFFRSSDPTHGTELWKSDGTPAGTVMVGDINPGPGGSYPDHLTNVNGTVFFSAYDPSAGTELWKSDGTAAGTTRVADLLPGAESSGPTDLTAFDGNLVFAASTGGGGGALWESDGTTAGTVRLAAFPSSLPGALIVAAGRVFFAGFDSAGLEPWVTDGTVAGTHRLADINPGPGSSIPASFTAAGTRVFFAADDGTHGSELWVSDGTVNGTQLVADLNSSPVPVNPTPLAGVGDTVFFASNGGLYKSDGTPGSAQFVTGLVPPEAIGLNQHLVFPAQLWNGYALLSTDGTSPGTVILQRFDSLPAHLTEWNGKVYFAGHSNREPNSELWVTDGTAGGTAPVVSGAGAPTAPQAIVPAGQALFFTTNSGTSGVTSLWKTDGTATGTILVSADPLFTVNGYPAISPVGLNGSAIYVGTTSQNAPELFSTNGTETTQLTDTALNSGPLTIDWSDPNPTLVAVDGNCYFIENGSLWRTDGTPAGTYAVAPVSNISTYAYDGLSSAGKYVYVVEERGGAHLLYNLWRSDGTAAGTVLLKSFLVDGTSSASGVGNMVDVNGQAYFTAWDTVQDSGVELWTTDGTPEGTSLVANIDPGAASSNPTGLINVNGSLYFNADDGTHGPSLWRVSAVSVPAAPTGFSAAAASPFSVSLSWSDPAADATGFAIQRSSSSDFAIIQGSATVAGDATSYTDPVADPGSVNYYRIVALNAMGRSSPTNTSVVTPVESWPSGSVIQVDPSAQWFGPSNLTVFHHQIFFTALTYDSSGGGVYRTDGVASIKILSGPATSLTVSPDGSSLIITQPNWANSRVLYWSSDGTAQGTIAISAPPISAPTGGIDSFPTGSIVIGNKGFYVSKAGDGSLQVFVTDNTPAGTLQLTHIPADLSIGGDGPYGLTAAYGRLYFFAEWRDPQSFDSSIALYESDGTPEGTVMLSAIPNGRFTPDDITASNGKIFFRDGQRLWVSDGTPRGTVPLEDFGTSNLREVSDLLPYNDRLYFTSHVVIGEDANLNALYNGQLWSTDGTPSGTAPISGLPVTNPASQDSPSQLLGADGTLWFVADNPLFSQKLFHYSQTVAGTGAVSGTVFDDANWNGNNDAGEVGLPGVTVYIDANNNGKLDPGEVSTTTDAAGRYTIGGLVPGQYVIREVLPLGYARRLRWPTP